MKAILSAILLATLPPATFPAMAGDKPTIVLVHGAFADSSSWNRVTSALHRQGYEVRAVANPLRGVEYDARYLDDTLRAIDGPVVLVGHSYGGLVIGEAADAGRHVRALVFVSAFAADVGETAASLSSMDPGSTLGSALAKPVPLYGGGVDLYIGNVPFPEQFAADVPKEEAALMAVAQRPITEAALNEPARRARWKSVPSWFIYGDADRNIPASVLGFMAARANARGEVVIEGGSHVVMVSHPDLVAKTIIEAASNAE